MSSDNDSIGSNQSIKAKNHQRSARGRRTNSIDRHRSLNSIIDAEIEEKLLNGADDDSVVTQKIEMISDVLDSVSNESTSTKMEIDTISSVPNAANNQNPKSNDNSQIMGILLALKTSQDAILASQFTKKEGTALKKSVDSKFSTINTELKAHNTKFAEIEDRMTQFEVKIASATYDSELKKQQALKNNISIFGCPKLDSENVTQTAINVFKAFGSTFNATDFSAAYRTTGKRPNFTSIIVKFVSFEKKLSALDSKSAKVVKVSDVLGPTQSNGENQIYLNNHVTPFFGRLLVAGRQAIKDEIIHSCWIGTMGCMVKMEENGKPFNVRTLDDFVHCALAPAKLAPIIQSDPNQMMIRVQKEGRQKNLTTANRNNKTESCDLG